MDTPFGARVQGDLQDHRESKGLEPLSPGWEQRLQPLKVVFGEEKADALSKLQAEVRQMDQALDSFYLSCLAGHSEGSRQMAGDLVHLIACVSGPSTRMNRATASSSTKRRSHKPVSMSSYLFSGEAKHLDRPSTRQDAGLRLLKPLICLEGLVSQDEDAEAAAVGLFESPFMAFSLRSSSAGTPGFADAMNQSSRDLGSRHGGLFGRPLGT